MTGTEFRETSLLLRAITRARSEKCVIFSKPSAKTDFAAELNLDEPDETGISFPENAEIKALAASRSSNLPSLADDSGLVFQR